MIQINRILVATDFSAHSDVALTYGAELAKKFDSEVILFHAVEGPDLVSQLPPGGEGYFPPNLPRIQEESAQKQCGHLLENSGIARGRARIEIGTPFVEIVRAAREEDVDLLIVGTHGRGALAHIMLGSVAERVVRKASCPVLTVRKDEHDFVMP